MSKNKKNKAKIMNCEFCTFKAEYHKTDKSYKKADKTIRNHKNKKHKGM